MCEAHYKRKKFRMVMMLMFRLASNIYAAINGITQKFHLGLSSCHTLARHTCVCVCVHVCTYVYVCRYDHYPTRIKAACRGVRSMNSSVKSGRISFLYELIHYKWYPAIFFRHSLRIIIISITRRVRRRAPRHTRHRITIINFAHNYGSRINYALPWHRGIRTAV